MGSVGFGILMGIVTAILAGRKGYNPALWFFAAGCIGLVVLAFLPFSNEESLSVEARAALKKRGDTIGGVIGALAVLFALLSLAS